MESITNISLQYLAELELYKCVLLSPRVMQTEGVYDSLTELGQKE